MWRPGQSCGVHGHQGAPEEGPDDCQDSPLRPGLQGAADAGAAWRHHGVPKALAHLRVHRQRLQGSRVEQGYTEEEAGQAAHGMGPPIKFECYENDLGDLTTFKSA